MTSGVLSVATQVSGVHGIAVVGGNRLNHGSASRTRTLTRSITARLQPGSHGSLLIDVAWQMAVNGEQFRTQVALPLPAARAAKPTSTP